MHKDWKLKLSGVEKLDGTDGTDLLKTSRHYIISAETAKTATEMLQWAVEEYNSKKVKGNTNPYIGTEVGLPVENDSELVFEIGGIEETQ